MPPKKTTNEQGETNHAGKAFRSRRNVLSLQPKVHDICLLFSCMGLRIS